MSDITSKTGKRVKFRFSLRLVFFLALLAMSVLSVCAFVLFGVSDYRERITKEKITKMQTNAVQLSSQLAISGYLAGLMNTEMNAQMSYLGDSNYGRVMVVTPHLSVYYDSYSRETGKVMVSEDVLRCLKGTNSVYRDDAKYLVGLTQAITSVDSKETLGVLVFTFSLSGEMTSSIEYENDILLFAIMLALILLVLSLGLSLLLLRPVVNLERFFKNLTQGFTELTIPRMPYSELNHISVAYEDMSTRMTRLESTRQEFVSNVSHELKTPMTSMKVLADSIISQENAPIEYYREFMGDIVAEIDRENRIINDLLTLVMIDRKTGALNLAPTQINTLLDIVIKRIRPIAALRGIELLVESYRPVTAEVDEVKIMLAISNLVENAVKYNIEDGWVRLSLNSDHRYMYLTVSDSGVGIPSDLLDLIFDRFYRVDKARSRETGGTGLGLSITKRVIQLHHGIIKVTSKENEGTVFTVRIPLVYSEGEQL